MAEALAYRSAFAAPTQSIDPQRTIGSLAIREQTVGLATVAVRKDRAAALAGAVRTAFGIPLLDGPKVAAADRKDPGLGELKLVGIGPGRWLAIGPLRTDFAQALADRFEGLAAVADQSGAYGVLTLAGTHAREVLGKGVPVDLHPRVFGQGDVAVTLAGHIGILLWQEDANVPTFTVAVPRSLAGSFRHWLEASAQSIVPGSR